MEKIFLIVVDYELGSVHIYNDLMLNNDSELFIEEFIMNETKHNISNTQIIASTEEIKIIYEQHNKQAI